jgi:hypothetical protein
LTSSAFSGFYRSFFNSFYYVGVTSGIVSFYLGLKTFSAFGSAVGAVEVFFGYLCYFLSLADYLSSMACQN